MSNGSGKQVELGDDEDVAFSHTFDGALLQSFGNRLRMGCVTAEVVMFDKEGKTIDFYLSPTRDAGPAKRFLGMALTGLKDWEKPEIINTDKAPAHGIQILELKTEGNCPESTVHRQVKNLNNAVDADHGKLKQLIRPVRGFETLKTTYETIMGFEVMRALRKGQAAIFNITQDIRGIVGRAFGIGAGALTEGFAVIGEGLEIQPALRLGAEQLLARPCPILNFATSHANGRRSTSCLCLRNTKTHTANLKGGSVWNYGLEMMFAASRADRSSVEGYKTLNVPTDGI